MAAGAPTQEARSERPRVGAAAAGAAAAAGVLLARGIRFATDLIALTIALAITLFVLGANPHNTIVKHLHDAARWLVGPFDGMFHLTHAKATLTVNWGLAALVWLGIGWLLARLVLMRA